LPPFLFTRPFRSLSRVCRAPTIFRTFPMPATDTAVERAYQLARERYESLGVDVGAVLETLARHPISLHCWQGDDVGRFQKAGPVARRDLCRADQRPAQP